MDGWYIHLMGFTVILVAMKRILFFVFACCLMSAARAQKVYFIYLQSENSTPFFVKMQDKVHSSSAAGFVILSNLKDSTYLFNIGFPGNPQEKKFGVTIDKGDRGFLLKNIDGDLGLYDLQTSGVLKPIVAAGVSNHGNVQTITKTDPFTTLLSQAADDASLLTVSVPMTGEPATAKAEKKEEKPETAPEQKAELREEPKTELKTDVATAPDTVAQKEVVETKADQPLKAEPVVQAERKPDTELPKADTLQASNGSSATSDNELNDEVISAQSKQETKEESIVEEYKRSSVQKRAESSTTEGFGLLFTDERNGIVDTIRLLIPNPRRPFVDSSEIREAEVVAAPIQNKEELKQEEKKEEVQEEKPKKAKKQVPKFLDFSAPEGNSTKKKRAEEATDAAGTCANRATERDFIRLRKYMASETNDEAMIDEAKRYFKNKCFTTEQIKNLSALFLTSAAKYQFFDAAYPYVTDKDQFSLLESEIKDAYYLKRFKALIGE